jgi:chloramphenicol O-acetyltransferase
MNDIEEIFKKYELEILTEESKEGYLNWSLDFFTNPNILQVPYIDMTIQLEVTQAYKIYQANLREGSTFFAFLLWHFARVLSEHPSFNLRLFQDQWYLIHNPPFVVPVAVGGKDRFWEMVLENVSKFSYFQFIEYYRQQLNQVRAGFGTRVDSTTFYFSCLMGNLPNLQFTGLTLHWQTGTIQGQPMFYFGKRYKLKNKLYIPFAAKLHHANTDPFVLDLLLQDFQNQIVSSIDD